MKRITGVFDEKNNTFCIRREGHGNTLTLLRFGSKNKKKLKKWLEGEDVHLHFDFGGGGINFERIKKKAKLEKINVVSKL